MDSASDFGSGGWGFESPRGLKHFFALDFSCGGKFGRVVKALALGASLERGMGSNPIACMQCCIFEPDRGCSSLGRAVGSQSAGTGIETLLLHFSTDPCHHVASANGVSVTLKLPKL